MSPYRISRLLAGLTVLCCAALRIGAAEKVVLQLPYSHQFQFAGAYAAQTQGYFRDEGLEVEIRQTSQQRRSSLAEVLGGRAEFGISQAPQLLASRLSGDPVVAVATIMQHSPQVLVTRAEDNLNSPQDLIGKRVALDETSLGSEIQMMFEREGIEYDKIKIVPNLWTVNELKDNVAEAMSVFIIDAPFTLAREGLKVKIIRPLDYGVDFYGDCLFTTETTLHEHPALVEKMRVALLRGWTYALGHQEEIIDWIVKEYPRADAPARITVMDREAMQYEARQMALLVNADLVEVGRMNPGRWQMIAEAVNRHHPIGSLERLKGFLYEPPPPPGSRFANLRHWLWWSVAAIVGTGLVALLALAANRRLRRLIGRRTQELHESQRRQHEIFDLAPAPIIQNDYTRVVDELDRLRASGVTDLSSYLASTPDALRVFCEKVDVVNANRLALKVAGAANAAELSQRRMAAMTEDAIQAFAHELNAIWRGRTELRVEKAYRTADGRRRNVIVNWSAPLVNGRPDYTQVQLAHTDVTEIRAAEVALRDSEERYRMLFEQSPLAIIEFDYAPVIEWFNELRAQGVTDIQDYYTRNPQEKEATLQRIPPVDINQAAVRLVGAMSKQEVLEKLPQICTESVMAARLDNAIRVWNSQYHAEGEFTLQRVDGSLRTVWYRWRFLHNGSGERRMRRTQTVMVDITEQRQAEQALRGAEQRYRALFESNPNPMWMYDPATLCFIAVNEAAIRAYGYSRDEFLGMKVTDIRAIDESQPLRELLPRGGSESPHGGIWEHRKKNGEIIAVDVSAQTLELDGRPVVLVVPFDITEVRRAGSALSESEERYRRLFETTPNPMYIFDVATFKFVMVNEAMVQRYGFTRAEFGEMSILDIRPGEESARLRESMRQFQAQPILPDDAYAAGLWRHRRKDGTIMLVEVFTHTLTLNGRVCVLVLPFDITAKLASERALRDSEARYRELFDNAVGGVYRSSPEGRFISVNPAMARILGFEKPENMTAWTDRHSAAALYVRPGRRDEFVAQMNQNDQVVNFESEIRRPNGGTVWISENTRAVRDDHGRLLYYEGFVSDITARLQLEAELTRASKLEAVGILAGGIAHDFNNILTVVLGNVTLAEMDAEAESTIRKMLRDAKQATLRARDLTQQLLTFAKGGDPVRAAVDLPELLRESAGFALHGAKARGEFALPEDLWPANADKGQIGQVVQNLVINAVQAMPDGGMVRIEAVNAQLGSPTTELPLPAGRYVHLTVSDTGVGIAAEHLPKIFDPYFTTKQQGSGLGLATVYSIVKKHQGHIEVRSRLGSGTTFHIWLPAAAHTPAAHRTEQGAFTPLRARVLFMDDEQSIRGMAEVFLQRLGVECETAADGSEAVLKYRSAREGGRPFDVVIMDLTVPGGMGGREAMEQLRLIDPGVRAIVSSGYSRDPVLANYRAHGFCGILPKPYGLEQLRQVLQQVMLAQREAVAK